MYSVHHHFISHTLSWCQISGKISFENFTVMELTDTQHFKRHFKRTSNIQTSSETRHHNALET